MRQGTEADRNDGYDQQLITVLHLGPFRNERHEQEKARIADTAAEHDAADKRDYETIAAHQFGKSVGKHGEGEDTDALKRGNT